MGVITSDLIIVLLAFYGLLAVSLIRKDTRNSIFERTWKEWIIDISSLSMQGVFVPFAKTIFIIAGLKYLVPQLENSLQLSPLWGFLIAFVLLDYLYYWNHRLMHKKMLWPIHALHHSPKHMDVLMTSRNALWTPFLIVYIWCHGLMFYLLKDPSSYLIGASLTAALDLWRHTEFYPKSSPLPWRIFSKIFITPLDHAWHHSLKGNYFNFGANLKIWDQLHGTYLGRSAKPRKIGMPIKTNLKSFLIFSRH